MVHDSLHQQQVQFKAQQAPIERGRIHEERFISEVAGAGNLKPAANQWQQFQGGPLDAQFVSSVEDAAPLMKPGMFVNRLGDVGGNNTSKLGEFRRPNGRADSWTFGTEATEETVASQAKQAPPRPSLRESDLVEVAFQATPPAPKPRPKSVIAAALAPLSPV